VIWGQDFGLRVGGFDLRVSVSFHTISASGDSFTLLCWVKECFIFIFPCYRCIYGIELGMQFGFCGIEFGFCGIYGAEFGFCEVFKVGCFNSRWTMVQGLGLIYEPCGEGAAFVGPVQAGGEVFGCVRKMKM
jgi:hypothetical protein